MSADGPGPLARLWMGALRNAADHVELAEIWGLAIHPKTGVRQHLDDKERECLQLAYDQRWKQLQDLETPT